MLVSLPGHGKRLIVRILLACAAFPPFVKGGGPVSSLAQAQALVHAGHEVRVLHVQDDDVLENYQGVQVHRLPSLNLYWNYYEEHPAWRKVAWHAIENFNPRAFWAVRNEIRSFRPDILVTISTENINVASWAAAYAERVPVAHCIYSYFLMCWRGSMYRSRGNCEQQCFDCRIFSTGKKALSSLVDGVYAETRFVLDMHLDRGYFRKARERVIPGVAIRQPLSRRQSAQTGPLRIGFIGAHTPNKGLETLAHAAQLLSCNTQVEFVIAGSGDEPYASELRAKFPKETTRFVGWIEPEMFFPDVDVIVVPSLWREPFARVIIEAYSYAVPVIGADMGGIPESIMPGETGYVFAAGNAAELAALIRNLACRKESVKSLSSGALSASRRYLPEKVGQEIADFYYEIVQNGGLGSKSRPTAR